MGLWLPPSISVSRFTGGFKSSSDYIDLADAETNDAQNCVYTPGGNLEQRKGSVRLYPYRLYSSGDPSTGRPITGHYYFDKLGISSGFNIVAAGDGLYNYTSNTASAIRTGLTDNSNTFWSFVQIQDPRSQADDLALMTNGVDPIQVWNGSATAILLSSFTSATQVPICKYLLQYKNRVYAANIVDATNVDNPVRVYRTGFGTDGLPDPHRFTENFFVGGSDKGGEIQGQEILNEQIIYYTRNKIWKFTPGLGDVNALESIADNIGLYAPFSLVNTGDLHIFLSERGVYAFDGNRPTHLSKDIDDLLLGDVNQGQLQYAKAVYDFENNQYKLYIPSQGQDQNDTAVVFDLRLGTWQPPVFGRRVNTISTFTDTTNRTRVIYGDYVGYLYRDGFGTNDGIETAYNGSVSAATLGTLTENSANFSTAGDGLAGLYVRIRSGTGEGQERIITANTTAVLSITPNWSVVPDLTSRYSVAGIKSYWRSKDYDFGGQDIVKLFRHVRVRMKEQGNYNLDMHYIVNFQTLPLATLKQILMLVSGMAWGVGVWGASRWGGQDTIRPKISLRNTNSQRMNGTHFALRFGNERANEEWKLSGFDIEIKALGKR